jgi:hypothetical protein
MDMELGGDRINKGLPLYSLLFDLNIVIAYQCLYINMKLPLFPDKASNKKDDENQTNE